MRYKPFFPSLGICCCSCFPRTADIDRIASCEDDGRRGASGVVDDDDDCCGFILDKGDVGKDVTNIATSCNISPPMKGNNIIIVLEIMVILAPYLRPSPISIQYEVTRKYISFDIMQEYF
mmetsp:Transcript_8371/g.9602  ORF Transcript_8371/g.9602 Transcript_8371/m.9602 type:complete len:120 (+) Transcript_8371:804-1163(+)